MQEHNQMLKNNAINKDNCIKQVKRPRVEHSNNATKLIFVEVSNKELNKLRKKDKNRPLKHPLKRSFKRSFKRSLRLLCRVCLGWIVLLWDRWF